MAPKPSAEVLVKSFAKLKAILTGAVLFLFSSLSPTFAAENPVGTIIGISGTIDYLASSAVPVAEVKPGDVRRVSFEKWEKVKFQQTVFAKDKFRTSRKSRLKILLLDKSLIALGPNSEMEVKSYLYNEKDKLRQGVIGVAHGFSMYIINKSQTNENSSFKVVTPTANIAARGTQGYMAISQKNTFTANKIGTVLTSNADPGISGTVELGPLMGNNVPKDGPPTPAKALSAKTMQQIGSVVMGLMKPASGNQPANENSLIEVQDSEEKSGEESQDPEGDQKAERNSPTDVQGSGEEGGGEEQNSEFTQEFLSESNGNLNDFYEESNNPFLVDQLESCTF